MFALFILLSYSKVYTNRGFVVDFVVDGVEYVFSLVVDFDVDVERVVNLVVVFVDDFVVINVECVVGFVLIVEEAIFAIIINKTSLKIVFLRFNVLISN